MTSLLTLPWPPSVNTYWRHPTKGALAGRHLISEQGRRYRNEVAKCVLVQKTTRFLGGEPIRLEIVAYVPDRRRRDLDNILKSMLDAITHAGVWADDTQVDDLRIYRARDSHGALLLEGKVMVLIESGCDDDKA